MSNTENKPANDVYDLRSALELLKTLPGEYVETDTEVDPHAKLSGVYRYVGAGGTCQRPTRKNGPVMVFNKVKGFNDISVAIGLNGSRKRVSHFLNCPQEKLGHLLKDSVQNPIPPVLSQDDAVCQQVVHLGSAPDFDLHKLLPAPTNTEEDAGPYITMGLCYASDPETRESDITIHRLCVQSRDELSMWLTPGRHIDAFRMKAEAAGQPLPISISIGVDPAIEIAACFEPPTTPLGYDELSVAGALRGRAVEMVQCKTINEKAISHAEIVIEGELLPNVRLREDQNTNTGKAMPEFPDYTGEAKNALPLTFGLCSIGLGINLVIKVKFMPAVVLAMVLGAVIGEVFFLEKQIGKAAGTTRGLINHVFPSVQGLTHDEFTEKFVAILVLFCASGTGIFGAMHEGMTGDPSIPYIKTVLDLFTAAIFATMLGFSVMTIGIPQIIVQVALATIAVYILHMITPNMMADFSCAGGLVMVATGFRICNINRFRSLICCPAFCW